ncbi:hypothetical protein [Enterococcus dongliensis]|uniref:hypothetical protein n=1 Tax=Enterococcus dongliensis TaxID=2559925 RepID=UPI00288DE66F|nr:hypothetical protein [Enterococcus dongliensis]MDT2668961.1 hypothetical protein [Enterococcus dongliensis]
MNKIDEVKELLTDTVAKIYTTIKDNSLEVTKEKGQATSCAYNSSNSSYNQMES